ncbi:type II secretion system protein J [Candidatus Omnitrophota bacterium]
MLQRRRRMTVLSCQGLSLVEVLVTVLILAMMGGIFLSVVVVGNSSWITNSIQVELQQEIRKAILWISDDLRQSGPTRVDVEDDSVPHTSIQFDICTGGAAGVITWSANPIDYHLDGNQLIRDDGAERVISHNIQTLQFWRDVSDIVDVQLVAQKSVLGGRTVNVTSSFQVQLRN